MPTPPITPEEYARRVQEMLDAPRARLQPLPPFQATHGNPPYNSPFGRLRDELNGRTESGRVVRAEQRREAMRSGEFMDPAKDAAPVIPLRRPLGRPALSVVPK